MAKTVRFLTECAGRNKGVVEEIYDETLAHAWVNARLAEFIEGAAPSPSPAIAAAPEGPPVDRMARRPPRRK